jgi:hypothetical protein
MSIESKRGRREEIQEKWVLSLGKAYFSSRSSIIHCSFASAVQRLIEELKLSAPTTF